MLSFTSQGYLLFLFILLLLYHSVSNRLRIPLLLSASYLFYGLVSDRHLLPLLLLVTLLTFSSAIFLNRCHGIGRTLIFWGSVGGNLAVLLVLKYFTVMNNLLSHLFSQQTLSALGVSYFVFQAISYLIDVYIKDEPPERNLLRFALYLAFFPKILQGPIERGNVLLPQLTSRNELQYEDLRSGSILFAWGLMKKVVIADNLAPLVDISFDNPGGYHGFPLIMATWIYGFQLYFDFSGYTDMALGSARLFGIRLSCNFNSPYRSCSIGEFWRRWHISFSRWIFDYIFIPLQMQLRDLRLAGTVIALLVTFFLSGVWHGATSGFIIWGLLHGIYLSISLVTSPVSKKLKKKLGITNSPINRPWQVFCTFNLVCIAWVFFRAETASAGIKTLSMMISWASGQEIIEWLNLKEVNGAVSALVILTVVMYVEAGKKEHPVEEFFSRPLLLRWSMYYGMLIVTLVFGVFKDSAFLYFKF